MARIYRFFLENGTDLGKDCSILPGKNDEVLDQLIKVLRVRAGDMIVLLDADAGDGDEYSYEVISAHKKEVALKFLAIKKNENELSFDLNLILCLPNKPEKLSFILQKAVELGVCKVFVVEGENSQMKHALKQDRLHRIIREAAEQSERAVIPEVIIGGRLLDFLKSGKAKNVYAAVERLTEENVVSDLKRYMDEVSILVGPEGGFSEVEKDFFKANGIKEFSLGKRILRMETAVILALGLVTFKVLQ
jgi:16S rRNA (uracil1498-N3)-methyltransferase